MTSAASSAFQPLKVGDITLQHRIALAPMTRLRASKDHVPQDVAVEYYAQRASYPGTLIITEATFIAEEAGGMTSVPGVWSDAQVEGWKKVVDAVHAKGSFVFLQLWALGRAADAAELRNEGPGYDVVSASDVAFEGGAEPRPMTVDEIERYVGHYAAAAKAFVERAGGDGVEIHAANGYLLDQFIQTNSNKRTDQYGGSVENRARFPLGVVAAVTTAVGEAKTGIRLSPFTTFQGMKMPEPDRTETFSYITRELKARHPSLAYLHTIEPRADGNADVTPGADESLDFLTQLWTPKVLLVAGGHKEKDAESTTAKYPNSVAVYGRYFTSNPDLVARVRHGVDFRPYDRETFYVPGPENAEGYTTYPVEYGEEGKL